MFSAAFAFAAALAAESPPPPITYDPATPPAVQPPVLRPQWIRQPNLDDMTRRYPPAALKQGIGARVQIECLVTAAGELTECAVVAEEPAGRGFGAASLQTAPLFQMRPTTADGQSVAGGRVRVTLRWFTD